MDERHRTGIKRLVLSNLGRTPPRYKTGEWADDGSDCTFPNCSKYCLTSSTVVDADRPPTKIFLVFVINCKEKKTWNSQSIAWFLRVTARIQSTRRDYTHRRNRTRCITWMHSSYPDFRSAIINHVTPHQGLPTQTSINHGPHVINKVSISMISNINEFV